MTECGGLMDPGLAVYGFALDGSRLECTLLFSGGGLPMVLPGGRKRGRGQVGLPAWGCAVAKLTGSSSGWPEPGEYQPAQPSWSVPMAMRAGDADRERAVDVLRAALAEGRLDQDEYVERMGLAYQARTYGDLAVLTGDLPAGPLPGVLSPVGEAPGRRARPVPRVEHTNALATAAFALGMLEFLTLGLTAIPAIICGHIAQYQIRRSGEQGAGMACFALIFGYLALAIGGLVLLGASR
jgi:hypothetical protein